MIGDRMILTVDKPQRRRRRTYYMIKCHKIFYIPTLVYIIYLWVKWSTNAIWKYTLSYVNKPFKGRGALKMFLLWAIWLLLLAIKSKDIFTFFYIYIHISIYQKFKTILFFRVFFYLETNFQFYQLKCLDDTSISISSDLLKKYNIACNSKKWISYPPLKMFFYTTLDVFSYETSW